MGSGEWGVGGRHSARGAHSPLPTPHSRFAPGDAVRVADRAGLGHCRTPFYLRGKPGVIAAIQGIFRNPEGLAYHKPGLPMLTLYKVRFRQRDLWGHYAGPASDELEVDIYEHWLEPPGRGVGNGE
jgi:nitrile hydratase subunit beta